MLMRRLFVFLFVFFLFLSMQTVNEMLFYRIFAILFSCICCSSLLLLCYSYLFMAFSCFRFFFLPFYYLMSVLAFGCCWCFFFWSLLKMSVGARRCKFIDISLSVSPMFAVCFIFNILVCCFAFACVISGCIVIIRRNGVDLESDGCVHGWISCINIIMNILLFSGLMICAVWRERWHTAHTNMWATGICRSFSLAHEFNTIYIYAYPIGTGATSGRAWRIVA